MKAGAPSTRLLRADMHGRPRRRPEAPQQAPAAPRHTACTAHPDQREPSAPRLPCQLLLLLGEPAALPRPVGGGGTLAHAAPGHGLERGELEREQAVFETPKASHETTGQGARWQRLHARGGRARPSTGSCCSPPLGASVVSVSGEAIPGSRESCAKPYQHHDMASLWQTGGPLWLA